jgi:hypothetical protein
MKKIRGNVLRKVIKNRNERKVFNELTENINIPDSRPNTQQTKHLSKTVNRNINNFLSNINGQSNNNEKYKFNETFNSTFHRKFSRVNAKEFEINTKHYTKIQFKELFESLLLGLMSKTNLGDSWYNEYSIKGEDEPRYQILSPMNEEKLLMYIDTYLINDQYYIDGSYNFLIFFL